MNCNPLERTIGEPGDRLTRGIPWGRVAVEGVVIVASILIAFGIDAWWDSRQRRFDEDELLAAVQQNLEDTRIELERVLGSNERSRRALDRPPHGRWRLP